MKFCPQISARPFWVLVLLSALVLPQLPWNLAFAQTPAECGMKCCKAGKPACCKRSVGPASGRQVLRGTPDCQDECRQALGTVSKLDNEPDTRIATLPAPPPVVEVLSASGQGFLTRVGIDRWLVQRPPPVFYVS